MGEIDPKEKKMMLLTDPTEKANLSISIDRQNLANEKLYMESELSELEKSVSEKNVAERSLLNIDERIANEKKALDDAIENKKPEYEIVRRTNEVENLKKIKAEGKAKIKTIENRFINRGITDPSAQIIDLKANIEKNTNDTLNIQLTFEVLLEKYQTEYEENMKNTKSLQDHIKDIETASSNIKVLSPKELQAKKEKLVKESKGNTPESYRMPNKISETDVAKSSADFKDRIDQLNKFAMARGIMRRTGGLSKKSDAGQFYRK